MTIISGRPRRTLEEWVGKLPISLIAEHGVWLRNKGEDWRMLKTMTADWKERVRPILLLYVDRLPGALLEEKEFSLAWHYRRADPEQASQRAKELLDDLAGYTRNIDVQVFEGNKVIEIRNSGVNKGTAGAGMAETIHAGFHSRHRRRLDGRGFVPRAAADGVFRARRPGQHGGALLFERPGDRAQAAARIEPGAARENCHRRMI